MIRVLIIDDRPSMWQGLQMQLLLEPDLEVVGDAASGEEALAPQMQPDVILIDGKMLGMDCITATRGVQATEPHVHTSLTSFLEHLPAHVHVILSTRADPPLPLTRLRGRGHLLEVRADQLRTTPGEARAFLHEVMQLDLPEHELAAVEKRTEGWLVGLQLVGLSLQGRSSSTSSSDHLEEISGQQGYILDYLTEEVLSHQEPAVQRFLLSTCILERLTAPLCDAVTGQRDSQQMLEALQRTNLFVVPLDSQRRWYRYHALFAEALRARLEQEEEMSVRELHQRASQWFAEQGDLTGAVQHALSACDWQRAADLIEQHRQIYEWTNDTYPLGKLLSTLRARSRTHKTTGGDATARYLDLVLAAFSPHMDADHHPAQHPRAAPLSVRERDVLHLLARGSSNQEIAETLVITLDTVKRHVSNVLSKLGASNRTQAVSRARELGLLALERQYTFDGHTPYG